MSTANHAGVTEDAAGVVRLGLIGHDIARSQAPRLHECAGHIAGLSVRYDLIVPEPSGGGLAAALDAARRDGFRGVNITHPFKEQVVPLLDALSPDAAALGAVNTVLFDAAGTSGFNTDRSGFVAAWRGCFGERSPGPTCIVGAGGVGRAIAFALTELGCTRLTLFDLDRRRAVSLSRALAVHAPGTEVRVAADVMQGVSGAEGIVNATPLGMGEDSRMPVPVERIAGVSWAFDAVYTPAETRFLACARAQGLAVLGGWELYFHQGRDAFELFHGRSIDADALRAALGGPTRFDS